MTKLRKSARGRDCTFMIPGVCNNDPSTVVLCHAPHPDKGTGYKPPKCDHWSAFGCSACHDEIDGRTYRYFGSFDGGETSEKHEYWFYAIRETQRIWIKEGLLK